MSFMNVTNSANWCPGLLFVSGGRTRVLLLLCTLLCSFKVEAQISASDYFFPLEPGNIWIYEGSPESRYSASVITSKTGPVYHQAITTILEEDVTELYGEDGVNNYIFSRGAAGIKLHFINHETCIPPFDAPLLYLPNSVSPGQVINGTVTTECGPGKLTIDRVATIQGVENIDVPAGRFSALHVTERNTYTYHTPSGPFVYVVEENRWLARGVGEVKHRSIDLEIGGHPVKDSETRELQLVYSNLVEDDFRDDGEPDCCIGDPINFATGNHFESETDYVGPGPFPLTLKRYYNGRQARPRKMGLSWQHSYASSIIFVPARAPTLARVQRANGRAYTFNKGPTGWTSTGNVNDRLVVTMSGTELTGATYKTADGNTETYDAAGKLVAVEDRNGLRQELTYQSGWLAEVTDSFGHTLVFENDGTYITQVSDPAGLPIVYAHDTEGRLSSVTFQDQSMRKYYYNEPSRTSNANIPQALTRIEDEEGRQIAQWTYDTQGRATSSQNGDRANKVGVMYNADGSATITDASGQTRQFDVKKIHGVHRPNGLSAPCNTCRYGAVKTHAYDDNGNRTSTVDFSGAKTTYTYDLARNLQTSRTEAVDTADTRTTTTVWHATLREPLSIFEPLRVTKYTYDSKGNRRTKTVQATTDKNGSKGAAASLTGPVRKWTYTYFPSGQIATITGPRTDIVDQVRYTYDDAGNLASFENAVKHVTRFMDHDANGQAGTIVDPNGIVTTRTYWPRGWLRTTTTAGETTSYDYDKSGRVRRVSLPDNSYIVYGYDSAGRLELVTDSIGNNLRYELDANGNRTLEEVTDPSGGLRRKISRTFYPNNLLKTVSGGAE